ncbi:tRNA pseudouridine(38-40) synthase TruA [Leuconostoc pseudomesenteroides]|uniref:tRNA pseudouridine(38-40) synthase TruA n=1 Tax=Leuconostoc pseudomesenteroides TaxID=33968 RepID=UPI0022869B88|nr:tRNA pseudouridine(38-40) synthase TruA [Leuconostoc pseudomesenteroides]WAM38442.1 tRNA pseudouridine(38-40) synthase TruA [Leuconostoc pseudomesenteroides]
MPRYKAIVAYDGTDFFGFQLQTKNGVESARTVQGELNKVVNQMAKKPQPPIKVIGASRTDTGVHAFGQVVHFDFPYDIASDNFRKGLNTLLPRDILVKYVTRVSDDFHARFNTHAKRYIYRISTLDYTDPFKRHYTGHFHWHLDVDRMKSALSDFIGEHDFASFAASGNETATTVRRITRVELTEKVEEHELVLVFEGNAFLYNQIRIMVGVLLEIGTGRRPVHDIQRLIAVKDREQARFTAPASGLYLDEISYND